MYELSAFELSSIAHTFKQMLYNESDSRAWHATDTYIEYFDWRRDRVGGANAAVERMRVRLESARKHALYVHLHRQFPVLAKMLAKPHSRRSGHEQQQVYQLLARWTTELGNEWCMTIGERREDGVCCLVCSGIRSEVWSSSSVSSACA